MKQENKIILEKTEGKFLIDFFELAFLTEACLPKSTIARHTFFMDVIDKHYHKMNWEQRKHLFTWIGKKLNMEHEESQIFYARFNPDNQFNLTTFYDGKKENVEAFLLNNNYYVSSNRKVNNNYIEKVEKLEI
jgi:hypothetical protein